MQKLIIATLSLFCSSIVSALSDDWLVTSSPSSPEITYYVSNGKTVSLTKFSSETMSLNEVAKSLQSSFSANKADCSDIKKDDKYLFFSCKKNEKKHNFDVYITDLNEITYAAILIGGATKDDVELILKDTESK